MFKIRGGVIEITRPSGTVTRIEPITGLSVTRAIGESLAIYQATQPIDPELLDRLWNEGLEVFKAKRMDVAPVVSYVSYLADYERGDCS